MDYQSIPNADLIRAVLDGKTVQRKMQPSGAWDTYALARDALADLISYGDAYEWRFKPEPVVLWGAVWHKWDYTLANIEDNSREAAAVRAKHEKDGKVLRIELDPDTLAVISATTEAP